MRRQQPFHEAGHREIEGGEVEAGEHVADLDLFASDAPEEHVVEAAEQDEADDPPENRHAARPTVISQPSTVAPTSTAM